MEFEKDRSGTLDLFTDSVFVLPFSFAFWRAGGDNVFISNQLKAILLANSNILDPYDFVRLMQRKFGGFLNAAVEKVCDPLYKRDSYTVSLAQNTKLKLSINRNTEVYIFLVEDFNESKGKGNIFEKILDSLSIPVWSRNKDLKLTYCNAAYANALESTKDKVISNNLELISSSKKNSVYVNQGLYSSKPKKLEEHIIINGSRRLFAIEESLFGANDESTGFAVDITGREEIETSYKDYKRQNEEVLDNISVPIVIFDAKTVVVFANNAFIKLFCLESLNLYGGCKFSDIIDYMMSNDSIISSLDITKYRDVALELFQTLIDPYRANINLKNGNTMAVTVSPNRGGGMTFMFEDISDKVALEREVSSISAVQMETLDHLAEGVVVFGIDNRVKMLNSALENILKKEKIIPDEHISDFFKNSVGLFESESEMNVWTSKLVNMAAQRIEFSDILRTSSGKTLNYNYVPLPDGQNLLCFLDVSDGDNLKKILKEKNDMISKIDNLKSNLISNISYELRAPLQTIKGFAEILHNKYFGELNEKQMEYCYGIANSVERVTDVVDAVISLANIEAGQMKIKYSEVNLLKFIKDTLKLFEDRAKVQVISILTDFKDESFNVFIDEDSMKQALFQLISRSVKATPTDGSVIVSVDIPQNVPDYFNLIVKDNGMPLSEEELINARNTLLNDSSGGSLNKSLEFGLVLANTIVRLHNGKITIDSSEKTGNVVSCQIPIKQFIQ